MWSEEGDERHLGRDSGATPRPRNTTAEQRERPAYGERLESATDAPTELHRTKLAGLPATSPVGEAGILLPHGRPVSVPFVRYT